MSIRLSLLLTTFAMLACTTKPSGGSAESAAAAPPSASADTIPAAGEAADRAALQVIETAARALADSAGCSSSGECAAAPVGVRGCGGPRDFVVYCRLTTDSAALFAKLEELASAERRFNATYQIASNCDMRLPPQTQLVGRVCGVK